MFRSVLISALVASSLLLSCSGHAADEDPEEGIALLLTEDDFAEVINEKPHFVMFFAPWCGHCKKLAPTWQELHETLGGFSNADEGNKDAVELDVGVARVDCTKQTALCSKHQVTGYPTLKFFKSPAEGQRYKGARTMKDLVTFVKKELGLLPSSDEPEQEEEAPKKPSGPVMYTTETFHAGIASGHHFIKFFAPWCGHCQRLAPVWEKLAESFSSTSRITIGKVDCTEQREVCNKYGVRGYPTLLWFTDGEQVGEKYAGDRSLDSMRTFALDQAKKPSKPIDTQEDDTKGSDSTPSPPQQLSNVLSLTEDNFQVMVDHGVTLVKFFAPWCGHCKEMAGAYEELGMQLKDHPVITIAEVDCTAQGNKDLCSKEEVKGFPTILVYRGGVRVASYEGDRSTSNMAQFVTGQLQHDEL